MKTLFLRLAVAVVLALAFACGSASDPAPPQVVPAVGVAIVGKAPRMVVGDRRTMTALVRPENATNKDVAWLSSDPSVATINGNGSSVTVTAVGAGEATIALATADGGFTDSCYMTVEDDIVRVASVALDKSAFALVPGANGAITAKVLPSSAANQGLTWSSSNEAIATVTPAGPGMAWVKAVATGTAAITATADDGDIASSCAVTVATYTVPFVGLRIGRSALQVSSRSVAAPISVMPLPVNAANVPAITWSSDDTGVATVTGSGLGAVVKGRAAGACTITATAGSYQVRCSVSVTDTMPMMTSPYSTALNHTLGIKDDGTLWGWGINNFGHLGIGSMTSVFFAPIRAASAGPAANLTWVHISASSLEYSAGIASDGSLWTWGNNANGRLGNGEASGNVATPVRIGTANDWAVVSCGYNHTMAIKADGTLWGWGNTFNGRIGNNVTSQTNVLTPVQIGSATNWRSVCAANAHTIALQADGTLWSWGTAGSGRLGNGTTSPNVPIPTKVGTDTDWAYISAGSISDHAFAIKTDGTLWGWGLATNGRVGNNASSGNVLSPTKIGTASDWHCVAAGITHSVGLRAGGELYTWGAAADGKLGNGSGSGNVLSPARIGTALYDYVAAGEKSTAVFTSSGELLTCGDFYSLGTGATNSSALLVSVGFGWRVP